MGIINVTNKKGASSIKGFVVSQTPYDGCNSGTPTLDFTLTLYHNGTGTYPVNGDTIYTNSIGTNLYTSADTALTRQVQTQATHLRVDADGIKISC